MISKQYRYRYRYVHKISNPRPRKWDGVIEIASTEPPDRRSFAAFMRSKRLLGKGERLHSVRVARFIDPGGPAVRIVVTFPQASMWHSIIFELVPRPWTYDRRHLAGVCLLNAASRYRWAAKDIEAERLVHANDAVNAPRILHERALHARIVAKIKHLEATS